MKKIIGVVFALLLTLSMFSPDKASAYLFHSSQICGPSTHAGKVKCDISPTPSQCISIGGSGNVDAGESDCVNSCTGGAVQHPGTIYYCEEAAPISCPANCPGTHPSCVANSGYQYNSGSNTCTPTPGVTPEGTLTANNNGVCTGTPGGTCTVQLTYSVNSGVTNASIWQCAKNGTSCVSVVSSIAYNSLIPTYNQNITVNNFNSSSAGAYVKLVNGASQGSAILADMYAAGIPQQSYTCTPSGPTYNRYQSAGSIISGDPGVTSIATDFFCGEPNRIGVACPAGTAGTAGAVSLTDNRYNCKTWDYSSCTCNAAVSCSAGTGSGGTNPSGTYPSCTCPGGQVYNSGSNSCACASGQTWDGGTSTCRTPCPAGATGTYSPSCTCPSPASYSSGSNTCTCPAPRTWNGSSCACPSGQVWDGSTCQTPCPVGTTGTYHPSCTCPAPRTYNTGTMACDCPVGQTWNGSTCSVVTQCSANGATLSYSNVTTTGFTAAWDCTGAVLNSPPIDTWLSGSADVRNTWGGATFIDESEPTGSRSFSGLPAGSTQSMDLWCSYYDQSISSCGVTLTTPAAISVTTNAASSINANGATMSFTVSGYNSIPVAGSIHLYQSDGTTHINNYTTSPATVNANGIYTATVSSLTCGTTYQFRGEAGATYGSKLSFTTSACPTMSVAWTNLPLSVPYGQTTSLSYLLTTIPAGQTATCDLYDYTGNNEISGISPQSVYVPVLANGGFETPVLSANSGQYNPTGASWVFAGTQTGTAFASNEGTAIRRSGWGWTNPLAQPQEGLQNAILRNSNSTITQTFNAPAGTYKIRFYAGRSTVGSAADVIVKINGVTVYTVAAASLPVGGTQSMFETGAVNIATGGSQTITFTSNVSTTNYQLDNVSIIVLASGAFTFNPSPATLPVDPSGYGYVVKCSVVSPATTAQSAVGVVTITTDGIPTASLSAVPTPGNMNYVCANSTGVKLTTTGGRTSAISGGQYVYSNVATPQTLVQGYNQKFRSDASSLIGQASNSMNYYFDRNNSGSITGSDVTLIDGAIISAGVIPESISGSFPIIQGATYNLECYGSYGTLPATTTRMAIDMTAKYLDSSASYPQISPVCPSDSTAYSISRSPTWSSSPIWSSGSIWAATNTDSVVPGTSTTTHAYTLSCTKTGGTVSTGQLTNNVNVPPAVVVNNMNSPMVATSTVAVVSWRSDGDNCDLKNYNGSVSWIGGITGTPISGGYQYSSTMDPGNPNFSWLNDSHIGSEAIGWSVTCRDTSNAARLTTSNSSSVQVYTPTRASITPPDVNGNLRFTCTRDFDYMDIKRNGTSLSAYPRTWSTNQVSPISILLPNLGGTYELVCKSANIPGNIDNDVYPDAGLQVYGSIGGNNISSIPTTAVVTGESAQTSSITSDGYFANLSYNIANATTWNVQFYDAAFSGGTLRYSCNQAGGCDSDYSMYRLASGTSGVDLYSSIGLPDTPLLSGGRWVITASDGISTKTLTLNLSNTLVPTGSLIAVPNPLVGTDAYDLYISCDNSTSYNLYNLTFATTTSNGLIVPYNSLTYSGTMTNKITYTATSSTGASSMQYRFECIGAGQAYVQEGSLPILSRQPAAVNKFTVYPQTVVCGGGKVALAWTVNNPVGKNCTLDATTTKPLSQYPSAQQSGIATGISTVKTRLNSNGYVIRGAGVGGVTNTESGVSAGTAFSTIDVNGNSVGELPRIQIRDNTRFSLSCVHQGVTTTVAIDARTACQGEQ